MSPAPETPELDKRLRMIETPVAGNLRKFVDWLRERGWRIGAWADDDRLTPIPWSAVEAITRDHEQEGGETSQHLGEWLAEVRGEFELVRPEEHKWGRRWALVTATIDTILHDFYGIDRGKCDDEQEALLAWLRRDHGQGATQEVAGGGGEAAEPA